MTEKRKQKIKQEAERRLSEWLEHSDFDTMTFYGSFIKFNMSLGLLGGYMFDKPQWMKGKKFNHFVTESEFESQEYDEIIYPLFKDAHNKYCSTCKKQNS